MVIACRVNEKKSGREERIVKSWSVEKEFYLRLVRYLQHKKHMMNKTQNTTGTHIATSIKLVGSCFSAIWDAACMSNSILSSLGSLHPYEFNADTRKAYLYLSLSPDIIHEVSAMLTAPRAINNKIWCLKTYRNRCKMIPIQLLALRPTEHCGTKRYDWRSFWLGTLAVLSPPTSRASLGNHCPLRAPTKPDKRPL